MNKLGEQIKELRKRKDWTLDDLAHKSDVSKAYLSQLESGDSERPSANILYNIAAALGTSIAVLLGKQISIPTVEKDQIPKSLRQAATEYKIPEADVNRLSAISMRDGKQLNEYSKSDWIHLYQTVQLLGRKRKT